MLAGVERRDCHSGLRSMLPCAHALLRDILLIRVAGFVRILTNPGNLGGSGKVAY